MLHPLEFIVSQVFSLVYCHFQFCGRYSRSWFASWIVISLEVGWLAKPITVAPIFLLISVTILKYNICLVILFFNCYCLLFFKIVIIYILEEVHLDKSRKSIVMYGIC